MQANTLAQASKLLSFKDFYIFDFYFQVFIVLTPIFEGWLNGPSLPAFHRMGKVGENQVCLPTSAVLDKSIQKCMNCLCKASVKHGCNAPTKD